MQSVSSSYCCSTWNYACAFYFRHTHLSSTRFLVTNASLDRGKMEAFVTKCLWYLVAVVLFCTTCEGKFFFLCCWNLQTVFLGLSLPLLSVLGLSPPYDLYWSINGAYVHLTWKHSHADEPLNGYYVSVALQQDSNHGWELTAPDFVHLDKNVRSTNIQGLIPDAVYQIKVTSQLGCLLCVWLVLLFAVGSCIFRW